MLELIEDFGYLYPTEKSNYKKRFGLFKCFCGNEFKTYTQSIKLGLTKSCGCIHKELIVKRNVSRTTHGLSKHKIYTVWKSMMGRCNNIKHISYKDYGQRGITVCERWLNVKNFIEDMYPSYIEGLTIDRVNVNGNYEPNNCRWANNNVQARNTQILRRDNTSGYRGVVLNKKSNIWVSQIVVNKKHKYIGGYKTSIDAAKAYDQYVADNNLEHTTNGVV